MNPYAGSLQYQPLLSSLATKFKNKQFIAEEIFKNVEVPVMAGTYYVWDTDVTFRRQNTTMAYYATPNMIDTKVSQRSFIVIDHALEAIIDPREEKQAPGIAIQQLKTQTTVESMQLDLEVNLANTLRDPTILTNGTTLTGTAQWSDPTSDPKSFLLDTAAGMWVKPNTLIVGLQAYNRMLLHPKLIEAIKYTQGAVDTTSVVARYFGVDRVIVGEAIQNVAAEGQAPSYQYIWGKDAIYCYIAPGGPSPLMDKPSLGYLAVSNEGAGQFRVWTYLDPRRGTRQGVTVVKVESSYIPLLTAPNFAYLIKNVVA